MTEGLATHPATAVLMSASAAELQFTHTPRPDTLCEEIGLWVGFVFQVVDVPQPLVTLAR